MTGIVTLSVAALLASALGWSCLDLLRKLLVGKIEPLPLLAWMTAANVPLFALWGLAGGFATPASSYWLPALGSVGLNLLANLAYFASVRAAPLSTTVPLLSFTPVFATLFAALVLGEAPGWPKVAGTLLVVAGALALTSTPGSGLAWLKQRGAEQRGVLLMLAVALLWAVAIGFDKLAIERANGPTHGTLLNLGIALPALALLALRGRLGSLGAARSAPGLLATGVLVGFSALALQIAALSVLWVSVIETVKRGVGNLLAVVFGRLAFGEPVTASKLVAALLMAVGVALVLLA